jgi:hypothetical protein
MQQMIIVNVKFKMLIIFFKKLMLKVETNLKIVYGRN